MEMCEVNVEVTLNKYLKVHKEAVERKRKVQRNRKYRQGTDKHKSCFDGRLKMHVLYPLCH